MEVHQVAADPDTTSPDRLETLRAAGVPCSRFTGNAYLVLGERPTLVDTGQLEGIVDAIRAHTDRLDAVLLTHQHGDHAARLDAVLEAFDAECYAYADHPRRTHDLEDGRSVPVGDGTVETVLTPGHTEDHVAFLGDDVLFSGDVVVANDEAFEGGSFGSTGGPGPAREQLIESLHRLLERLPPGVDRLYGGHGDVFTGDVRGLIETALERAERREPKYG